MITLKERVARALAKYPDRSDYEIAHGLNKVRSSTVAIIRATLNGTPLPPEPKEDKSDSGRSYAKGVSLGKLRVLPRRPAENAAKHIKRLPAGRGFSPKDLSQEWGISETTLKRHARDLGCLKFVEIREDDWELMIVSPETAALYQP